MFRDTFDTDAFDDNSNLQWQSAGNRRNTGPSILGVFNKLSDYTRLAKHESKNMRVD